MWDEPAWIEPGASTRTRRDSGRARRRNMPWSAVLEWPSEARDFASVGDLCAAIAEAPVSGLRAQLAGPSARLSVVRDERSERRVADLGGLDHAIEGPWEWDVRALAMRLAGAVKSADRRRDVVREFAGAYRAAIRAAAVLEQPGGWQGLASGPGAQAAYVQLVRGGAKGKAAATAHAPDGRGSLTSDWVKGRARIARDRLPFDVADVEPDAVLRMFAEYREALSEALAMRLQRCVVIDAVVRAEGGGLLVLVDSAEGGLTTLLQTTPVGESVWEPYAGDVVLGSDAQRVLLACALLQVSPDPMLGWSSDLRQVKSVIWSQASRPASSPSGGPQWLRRREAAALGSVLGRAHARTIDAPALAGYLGGSDGFDRALAESTVG